MVSLVPAGNVAKKKHYKNYSSAKFTSIFLDHISCHCHFYEKGHLFIVTINISSDSNTFSHDFLF
jgi:hypothetical protein